MRNIQKIFKENLLLKVTSINGVGTIVALLTGIITQKALAIFVGPQGLGMIGNFRDFLEAIKTISTAGIANGIVKYVSEFKKDVSKLTETLSTAMFILLVPAIVLSLALFFSAAHWNQKIFSEEYNFTLFFKIAALALPLYAINLLIISVINGYAKYKIVVSINIVSNVVTLCILLILLWQLRLEGALYAILLAPVLSLLITLGFIFKKRYNIVLFKISGVSKQQFIKFFPFMIMALISSISLPVVRIAIR
ncbi:MAG: oligosaccharide flippase family protein, partial [Flavobacteriales bacterium]|nr:oligosaccharide flippase family protein [Flavobacteriales bacterium]